MNTVFTKDFLGDTSNQYQNVNFRISVVDYTQKVSEDWHFHDKVHVSAIMKGGNLESRKTKDIQVTPGEVMVYEAGEIHRNRFTAHPSRNLNIEFETDFFGEELRLSRLTSDDSTHLGFHSIYLELLLNDAYSTQAIEQMVKSLFWSDVYDSEGHWVSRLKDLLNDRWNEFPSLADISLELGVHPVTISKYFFKHCGMTLSEYMRLIKVKRALGMLMGSTRSLAQVAFHCGFSDQSHMNRLVRKYTGYTPGVIRSL